MFSRKFLNLILASVFAVGSVGCTEFLDGKKAEPEVIEFSDTRFKCLQAIPGLLQKYSVGEGKEAEVREGFDCMTDALRYFNKRTFGSIEGAYTVDEMRKFFGKYFLKQNNVTPEFAAELMKIKRALLGGSTAYITKEEITRIIDILNGVRDEAILLAPHMKIILLAQNETQPQWESISAATEQLRSSLQKLLEKTQIAKSDYSFEDAKRAFTGFSEFIRGNEPFAPYTRYSQWLPIVESVKNVLMGQHAQFTGLYQWSDSLNTLIDLYELALKYHYSLKDLQFDNKEKLQQVSQFVVKGLNLLMNAHQMKTTGRIPTEDIDNLIDQVLPNILSQVQTKSMKKTYRAVLTKILDPERKSDLRSLLGLERKHLVSMTREVNSWRMQQDFIDTLISNPGAELTGAEVAAAFDKYDVKKIITEIASEDVYEQSALYSSWLDLGEIYKTPVKVNFTAKGRLSINANPIKQTWESLTKGNIMRSLSRMLLLGYATTRNERFSAVTISEAGLKDWYSDFNELGIDMKAFDPRSGNSGSRSFQEANFFTYSGNGNDGMDHKETFEFVSTLFAAGLSSSESLRLNSVKVCAVDEKDVFGYNYLREDCFKAYLKQNFATYFDNLPGMVRYVNSLDNRRWNEYYSFLAIAAEAPKQRKGFVETANIRTMVTILHYIEVVVTVYDKDRNDKLSLDEVYDATPRFMPFVRSVKKDISNETLLTEGFAYLVFKGSIPGAWELTTFQVEKMAGLEDAERMEIARIFGTLKDQLNKSKN